MASFLCQVSCFTGKAFPGLKYWDTYNSYSDVQAARHWQVNPWSTTASRVSVGLKPDWNYQIPMCNLQLIWGLPFPLSPIFFFCCSNKTDILKYISYIAVARTSNVSQIEIKYSILFGTSQPNSIFPPSTATRRPSIWQLKDTLSSELDSEFLSMLLIIHLFPLPESKHFRSHKGAVCPFVPMYCL